MTGLRAYLRRNIMQTWKHFTRIGMDVFTLHNVVPSDVATMG
jgi:hypothetical protein